MSERVYDFRRKDEDFSKYRVMAKDEFPDATIALQQGDTPIFTVGDISTITGIAKSRKTFLLVSIAVAFLRDDGFMGMNSDLQRKKLLFIDTEQSRRFVWILVRRIYRLMRWDFRDTHDDSLMVLSLREETPAKRWEITQEAIKSFRPTLVAIDGSADLIEDPNNSEESNRMVNNLMKLSSEYNCHICSVVHTNPNSEKTRGHFGSELQRKSETVMLVTKEGDFTSIKPQFTRNMDFLPFAFRINDNGLPEATEIIEPKKENLSAIFEEIYSYSTYLSWSDLQQKIMEVTGKGKTAAENRIKKGLTEHLIYKDIEGFYRLHIEDNIENETLPF